MNPPTEYAVTLRHLSPDALQAGAHFKDTDLTGVSPAALRGLLKAFTTVARESVYPVAPELRIMGPTGRFLVQAREGQVRLTSWAAKSGAISLSPEQILEQVTGIGDETPTAGADAGGPRRRLFGGRSPRWAIAVLAIAILGTNALTAWFTLRPTRRDLPGLMPAYRLVDAQRAGRIFGEFAGRYETGAGAGERSLTIAGNGTVKWVRYGADRSVDEDTPITAAAGESGGRPVLVASNGGVIELKDAITLTFFGDTYRRK